MATAQANATARLVEVEAVNVQSEMLVMLVMIQVQVQQQQQQQWRQRRQQRQQAAFPFGSFGGETFERDSLRSYVADVYGDDADEEESAQLLGHAESDDRSDTFVDEPAGDALGGMGALIPGREFDDFDANVARRGSGRRTPTQCAPYILTHIPAYGLACLPV